MKNKEPREKTELSVVHARQEPANDPVSKWIQDHMALKPGPIAVWHPVVAIFASPHESIWEQPAVLEQPECY